MATKAYQSEAELENLLIKQLVEEGYEEIEVKDYAAGDRSHQYECRNAQAPHDRRGVQLLPGHP